MDPAGRPAAVPDHLRPFVAAIATAIVTHDGIRMIQAVRRLISMIAADGDLAWLWAAAQQDLGDVLNQVWPGDRDDTLDEIIRAYRAALQVYSPQVCPVEYATIQNNLGNAYRIRRRGSVEQNVEESITAYQAALTVRRRDTDPYGWARTQNNLGNGYAERRHGDPGDNARLAIASFRAALEVHDVVTYPDDYAMDQTNLGLTYQDNPGGDRARNLDLAMACFLCALLIRTPQAHRRRHRRLVLSLADAFRARVELTPEPAREDVIAALHPVVETLRTAGEYPGIGPASPGAAHSDRLGLPDPGLFTVYRRDRRRLMPLADLDDRDAAIVAPAASTPDRGVASAGVSFSQYPPVSCVNCAEEFTPELYVIVDTGERPDLVQLIKDDIVHCAICPHCGVVMTFDMPLLVYRPQEPVPVIYSPATRADQVQQREQGAMLVDALRQRLGPDWDDRLARQVYTVDRSRLRVVVDRNPHLLPGGRDRSLRRAMDQYLNCATWEDAEQVVERHSILLRPEAEMVLGDGAERAAAAGDSDAEATMIEHLDVLRQCRTVGVRAAFAAKTNGSGRTRKTSLEPIGG
jgi:hypothetical protein